MFEYKNSCISSCYLLNVEDIIIKPGDAATEASLVANLYLYR